MSVTRCELMQSKVVETTGELECFSGGAVLLYPEGKSVYPADDLLEAKQIFDDLCKDENHPPIHVSLDY